MSAAHEKRLALFDFDGTLTDSDSLFSFLLFFRGNLYFIGKIIRSIPALVAYKLGFVNNSIAKEKLLSFFLKNVDIDEFDMRCKAYCEEKLPSILNASLIEKFHQHISNGDRVLIVSASVENWILPWASQFNVEVLGTRLSLIDGVLTGKFFGANCNGAEKVKRIKAHLDIENYSSIIAYGDSKGDEQMIKLADIVFYKGKKRTV